MPSLIGSRDDVDESVRNLEVHFLANMGGDIYFALLSDWPDSAVEQSVGDREVLDYARGEIGGSTSAIRCPTARVSTCCTAGGSTTSSKPCWMGWERKRGKLHELNLLLRGDRDTTFCRRTTPLPTDVVQ